MVRDLKGGGGFFSYLSYSLLFPWASSCHKLPDTSVTQRRRKNSGVTKTEKSVVMRDTGGVNEKRESEDNKEIVDERWGSEREIA